MMAKKVIGKHANRLREAHGQFSSQSHEPFLRKCLYKETIPENMVDPQKKLGNLRKSAELLPFVEGNMFTMFQTIFSSSSLTKILTFNIPTDGKEEEQAKYPWPLKSTQISTFSHQKALWKMFPSFPC